VKVGLIQFAGKQDKRANLRRAEDLIAEAARQGAQIVSLQELANTIYFPFEETNRYFEWAEQIPGPSIEFFGDLARQHGIVLVAPIFERHGGGDFFNSAVVLGPDGGLIGTYRKNSIPHIRREGQPPASHEKYYFRPGNLGFPVFPTPLGVTLGVLICYDRHFPEAFRTLGLGGAHLVAVPTSTVGKTRNSHSAWFFEL
jgi:N-carbamoylputrescine amidase